MNGSSAARAGLGFVGGPKLRVLDMRRLVAEPPAPIPWVAHDLAASGMLTTLVGPAGLGKSWLGLLLAAGVHHGRQVGGIECTRGHAIYFDAENGPRLLTDRFHHAQIADDAMTVVDADGLDLARRDYCTAIAELIEEKAATLVVLDSLKRMTPTTRENENDEMAPVIAGLARLARRTGSALLLLHHKSVKSESADFRGASAIIDQSDMLFGITGTTERFKLYDHKFRLGPSPEPRWLGLRSSGGIVTLEALDGGEAVAVNRQQEMRQQVLELAVLIRQDGPMPREEIATRLGVDKDDKTLQRALKIVREVDGWHSDRYGYHPPAERDGQDTPLRDVRLSLAGHGVSTTGSEEEGRNAG